MAFIMLRCVSSTTTFAFNRDSAKYMKESPWDIAKMLLSLPRMNRQIRRLREKIEKNPGEPEYIFTELGVGYRMIEDEGL